MTDTKPTAEVSEDIWNDDLLIVIGEVAVSMGSKNGQRLADAIRKQIASHTTALKGRMAEEIENSLLKAVASVTLYVQTNDEILIGLGDAQNAISDTLKTISKEAITNII